MRISKKKNIRTLRIVSQNDQERLAAGLEPFIGPDGKFLETPDELLLLMKKVGPIVCNYKKNNERD